LYFTITAVAYLKVKDERELQMPFKVGDLRSAAMSAYNPKDLFDNCARKYPRGSLRGRR